MAAEIFKAAIFNFEMGEKNEQILHASTASPMHARLREFPFTYSTLSIRCQLV